jgi:murein DD-endopeptidase MepM/ murein hydrolase activator NlpD
MSISRGFPAVLIAAAIGAAILAAPTTAGAAGGGIGPSSAQSKQSGTGVFPVRGRYSFGDGLGAGRGHQGQDILARCGRPVVATMPGRVRIRSFQASGAGNYVVVKGKGSPYDYVYMHMLRKLNVKRGDWVKAGDPIGRVGSTGRSSACHLHFEMWTHPGWYRGGRASNPTPFLKRWRR